MLVHKFWSLCTILHASSHFSQPFTSNSTTSYRHCVPTDHKDFQTDKISCRVYLNHIKISQSLRFQAFIIKCTIPKHIHPSTLIPSCDKRPSDKTLATLSFLVRDKLRKELHSLSLRFLPISFAPPPSSHNSTLSSQTNRWNCNYKRSDEEILTASVHLLLCNIIRIPSTMDVSIQQCWQRIGCFARVATIFSISGYNLKNTFLKQSKDFGTALRIIIRLVDLGI